MFGRIAHRPDVTPWSSGAVLILPSSILRRRTPVGSNPVSYSMRSWPGAVLMACTASRNRIGTASLASGRPHQRFTHAATR
jgi:hypothetical protein